MFQEISPHTFDNHFERQEPKTGDLAVYIQNDRLLAKRKAYNFELPSFTQEMLCEECVYLFTIDSFRFFLLTHEPEFPEGEYLSFREIYSLSPSWLSFGALTALRLGMWYQENKYCGKCGHLLSHSTEERMLFCPECGTQIYPRINPAVIVAVRNGEKLLLTKYAHGYAHYALVAGFTESGETIEETVRREVLEETGSHVKNIRYFSSQPWPHSGSLLFGFYCDLDGDEQLTIQRSELSVAEWIDRSSLPHQANTKSLTSTMIEAFRSGIL
ncbi:MAG: NAD(+) diphosphatase [Oscillospiraceae bacterium]|nr:NAD(+) diphosphatase [Oscillospiraceae bacterium]